MRLDRVVPQARLVQAVLRELLVHRGQAALLEQGHRDQAAQAGQQVLSQQGRYS